MRPSVLGKSDICEGGEALKHLPREVMDVLYSKVFMAKLDGALSNVV